MTTGVIVGGTGAQGAAVVHHLSSLGYHLRVLTRNLPSAQAQQLQTLPNVTLIQSAPSGHDDASFLAAAEGADFAWINTDGFSIGEVAETYWGIHFYELSVRAGVGHYIYSGLDNFGPATNFDAKFMIGHYNGKARVVEYLKSQPSPSQDGITYWSTISSGPYIEMLSEALTPTQSKSATGETKYLFTLPLGQGSMPLIHLSDFAKYVQYIIEHRSDSPGQTLEVATALATGEDIASAFTNITGKSAEYVSIPTIAWIEAAFKKERYGADTLVGFPDSYRRSKNTITADTSDNNNSDVQKHDSSAMTFGENFTAWWNVYQHSPADGSGIFKRDFELLDRILPERVRSVEEWMRKVGYTGEKIGLLKRGLDKDVQE